MNAPGTVSTLVLAGFAAASSGQLIVNPNMTARIDLTWAEDPGAVHNDNGVLEPGERALLLMSLSFTGQYQYTSIVPVLGAFTSGTVTGLGSAYLDIRSSAGDATGLYNGGVTAPTSSSIGPNADSAGSAGYGVRGGWRLGGNIANGHPVANGFANIGPAQLPSDPTVANQKNPIANLERLGWAPASYAPRTQTFSVFPAAGTNNNVVGLYLDLDGGTTGGSAYLLTSRITFGSVNIPIAPAPAASALLIGTGLLAVRRRVRPTALTREELP